MKKFTRGRIQRFLTKYATTTTVLDIGSGGANWSGIFPHRITFDIDPSRNPEIVGDIHAMPFADASQETILCLEVFEHLITPPRAVAEMYRVLKPGGLLILTTRFAFPVHDVPGDFWRYTPYALRHLFREWRIVEIEYEADPFTTIAILLQRIVFQTDVRGGKFTKGIIYLFALTIKAMHCLILTQYGDIKRTQAVENMLFSGIYLVCRKPYQ